MDEIVLRSLARWPNVPAVYGWLRLDARGAWRLRNAAQARFERIEHDGLRAFIARNYAPDAQGRWFFQNGPQRVFVTLECTPLVYRFAPDGLEDHCGRAAREWRSAWIDDAGGLIVQTEAGVGVLDDRDLGAASALLVDADGGNVDAALEHWLAAGRRAAPIVLRTAAGTTLTVGRIARAELAARFGFVADPQPA